MNMQIYLQELSEDVFLMVQVNHSLTVITQEDSSHQQKEQQRDSSSHSKLHTSLFDIW